MDIKLESTRNNHGLDDTLAARIDITIDELNVGIWASIIITIIIRPRIRRFMNFHPELSARVVSQAHTAEPSGPPPGWNALRIARGVQGALGMGKAGALMGSVRRSDTLTTSMDEYYDKYTGYAGSFCDDRDMVLEKLLCGPMCVDAELLEHVKREHTEVADGQYGASMASFTASNYQVQA